MIVKVLSKIAFDDMLEIKCINNSNVQEYKKTFFISIINTGERRKEDEPTLKDSENVKVLYFDDTTADLEVPIIGEQRSVKACAMTYMQAEELVSFIVNNKDKANCIVHCSAGISRSGAVGTFINDLFGIKHQEFIRNNPYVLPNPHVLSLLRKAYRYYHQ
jgi:predicted protein tyrosine phosphatase